MEKQDWPYTRPRFLLVVSFIVGPALSSCDGDTVTPTGPKDPAALIVDSIEMFPPERTIGVLGVTVPMVARALAEDGQHLFSARTNPNRFSWSSSAPEIASVDQTGLVTALSEGSAVVSATSEGVTGETGITVRDAAHLSWTAPTGQPEIRAGVTVGLDGTIYVAGRTRLLALSPTGAELWTLNTPSGVLSTPAIGDDGTIYIGGTSDGGLTAVNPDGSIRWEQPDVGDVSASPALGADGTIYVGGDHHVYAVSPEGEIQWAYEGDNDFFLSSPAIGSDGTIYIGNSDGYLHAIKPDGSPRWTFKASDQIQSSPAIGLDGAIYFGSYDERLYALNPDGTRRWTTGSLVEEVSSSPSIGLDGTIYVGAGGLHAIDPDGSVRWSFGGSRNVVTTPLVGADGTVYVVMADPRGGVLQALDADGRPIWDYPMSDVPLGSPAIGIDGAIIATSRDRSVYAIVETPSSNGGHGGAPWPQARGNRANTGRAGG